MLHLCMLLNGNAYALFHTSVEIDHDIISTAFLLSSADSRRVVVSYKRKYVHEILVNGPGKKCG